MFRFKGKLGRNIMTHTERKDQYGMFLMGLAITGVIVYVIGWA